MAFTLYYQNFSVIAFRLAGPSVLQGVQSSPYALTYSESLRPFPGSNLVLLCSGQYSLEAPQICFNIFNLDF